MKKIVLEQHQSPGDIVVMTGAVRDLKLAHPEYEIMPDTTCMDVWLENPYITFQMNRADPEVKFYTVDYNDVHNAGKSGRHFSNAFHLSLEEKLGVRIPQTSIWPDLHMHKPAETVLEREYAYYGPYWILNAGFKKDFPLKHWGTERYQQLVNLLRDRIQFVQVGEQNPNHEHTLIDGAFNLIGKTSMRDFLELCFCAQGSVGPVSMHLHVMAAFRKPCVVINGGREPYRWESYPNQRYIHTCGCLPCCSADGCWKNWRSIADVPESKKDAAGEWRNKICCNRVGGEAHCMAMIEPEDVAREILKYYDGGML